MPYYIDLGNQCLKWVYAPTSTEPDWTKVQVVSYSREDEYGNLLSFLDPGSDRIAYISNVSKTHCTENLQSVLQQQNVNVVIAKTELSHGALSNNYQPYHSLGIDRWLAAISASKQYTSPCLIVCCGTYVTVDFIDGHCQHQGGMILPGFSQLYRDFTVNRPDQIGFLGKSTNECLYLGLTNLIWASIEQFIQVNKLSAGLQVVITGGDGIQLYEYLRAMKMSDYNSCMEDNLVLKGLFHAVSK